MRLKAAPVSKQISQKYDLVLFEFFLLTLSRKVTSAQVSDTTEDAQRLKAGSKKITNKSLYK